MDNTAITTLYFLPLAFSLIYYLLRRSTHNRKNTTVLQDAIADKLTEPASLHPLINADKCVGCGSCVHACPENQVLGLIKGKVQLINPTHCIGHGCCKEACPMNAIELVFGTATRGVDIPHLQPNFETNVPGIFIAGELGGMGLIKNAITQGKQAVESIKRKINSQQHTDYDLIIVGAGPAGIAASLAAKKSNLRYLVLEQESLGGTVSHFPRGKIVMTAPTELPIVGKVHFRETSKEELMEFWKKIETDTDLNINYRERVESVTALDQQASGYQVVTNESQYTTHALLLAIGRRGTPRKLDVPGEDLPKVVYRLDDPEQYQGKHVTVVGGGDSALEAALAISEQPGTTVTLSYRSDAFSRAKKKNRTRISAAGEEKKVAILFNSNVKNISKSEIEIEQDGQLLKLKNDAVIISAGGILPTPFLKQIGINVETKYGTN